MNCLACGSRNNECYNTKMSDFLSERIYNRPIDEILPVKLYHCNDCGFAFYDKRFNEEEEQKLYFGYRSDEYQKMRQKHDVWYTSEINVALGADETGIRLRRGIIESIIKRNIATKINQALDYGGDRGQKYPTGVSIAKKYVYDISGVETVEGVTGLSSLELARKLDYDFIMCNQVLEHISDLDGLIQRIKSLGNNATWFYFDVPFDSPFSKSPFSNFQFIFNPYFKISTMIKHFVRMKTQGFFAPMTEHINYFTPESMKRLLNRNGFNVIDCQENVIVDVLGKGKIISVLCKIIE